jgi:predicted RNase H-like HicB family nuclease
VDGSARTPEDYLKEPYARVLLPDEETGTYAAEILEFPGCVAQGDTPEEAYRNLEEAAKGWIQAALDLDQDILEPAMNQGYGGRIALRLPRGLHRRAAQMAEREGTSLNQFLVAATAERVGASSLYGRMVQRLEQRAIQTAMQQAVNTAMRTVTSFGIGNVYGDINIVEVHPLDETAPTPAMAGSGSMTVLLLEVGRS